MAIEINNLTTLLQVYDMPAALQFYCGVLGFEVTGSAPARGGSFDWVLLEWNGVQLMLNTRYEHDQRPAQVDPIQVLHHDDTGLFFACKDVDAVYAYLIEKGLKIDAPVNREYGMRQLYLHDPDGYNLCFQAPIA